MPTSLTRTPFARGARQLGATRLRALAEVLPRLYAETDLARLPARCTQTLADLVLAEAHTVIVHHRATGQRWAHFHPATAAPALLVRGLLDRSHDLSLAAERRASGTGEALALSDFIGLGQLERLRLYTDYLRPLGIEDSLAITVTDDAVTICMAALRRLRGFRREERETMNALRPHLRQVWRTAQAIAVSEAPSSRPRGGMRANFPRSHCACPPLRPERWTPDHLEACFGLTPREADVLLWVAQGKTNPEVATILGISRDTVRAHLERIFLKLHVETRHAATIRAIEALGTP